LSSRARRPYLMGDASVVQFYQNPARYLKEMVAKESTFEKPYLDEEYRKMHFDFPVPDWPPFPDFPPFPDIPGPTPGLSWCAITCYTPLDCDEPIWCHPSIWCGTDLECNLCSWVVEGATSGYSPHAMSLHWNWGIDVWIDSELVEAGGEALIHVQMTDPCGNLCGEDVEVTCKVCPPETVISWNDDLSAETIGRSEDKTVTVKDGLGPYKWSVAGTGFSLLHNETIGVGNTLQADASACGTATITVTDYCEDSVIGYVRGTEGSDWVQKSTGTCVAPGAAVWYGSGTGTKYFEAVYGYQRQREVIVYHAFRVNRTCGVDDGCTDYCIDGYHCLNSPFIDDLTRNITPNCQQEGADIRCWCGNINLTYWEWECV